MDITDRFGHCPMLPETVKDVFRELCQELVTLHRMWRFYLDLFSEEANRTLMDRRAPAAFVMIESALRNDITMGISRLSDPRVYSGHENLSLENLCHRVGPDSSLDALRTEFEASCKPFKHHRNKRVGHNDLKTVLGQSEGTSPPICRKDVEQCLNLAGILLNALYRAAGVEEVQWCFDVHEIGGGTSLVECLKLADRQICEKRAELLQQPW